MKKVVCKKIYLKQYVKSTRMTYYYLGDTAMGEKLNES